MKNIKSTYTRSYECDETQDEDLIGPDPRFLECEEVLLEAMVKRAIEDCGLTLRVSDKLSNIPQLNPEVREAWNWIMDSFENDWNTPFTFAWCCENIGYHQDGIRRLVRERFGYLEHIMDKENEERQTIFDKE